MPSPNIVKVYAPNQYYHLYNRGLDKRPIFIDDHDYRVFLDYVKVALSPLSEIEKFDLAVELRNRKLRRNHYPEDIELLAFCLMSNHFHIFIYQKSTHAIKNLMQSVITGYVQYFNRRHNRLGPLFQ